MKKSLLFTAAFALASCMSFTACSDDDDNNGNKLVIDPDAGGNKLTLEYDMHLNLGDGYEGKALDIELNKIAEFFALEDSAALITAMSNNDISMFGLKANGEVDTEHGASTTNGTWGHWCAADGSPCTWGDDAYVFAEFNIDTDNGTAGFGCGQFPGRMTEATTITVTEGLAIDVDTVLVKINFIIAAEQYDDPETAPAGNPENASYEITVNQAFDTDYAFDKIDVKDQLRNAFKMTTYQIYQAVKAGELNAYINAVADTVPSYTAEAPGFWMTSNAEVCKYGAENCAIWFSLYADKEVINMGGGNYPSFTSGCTTNFDFIIAYKGTTVTYKVKYILEAAAKVEAEKAAEYSVSAKIVADTVNYSSVQVEFDAAAGATALGVDSLSVANALSFKAGDEATTIKTQDTGFWYDMEGNSASWGENASVWVGMDEYGKFTIGQYPGHCKAGETYKVKYGFLNADQTKYVLYNIEITFE